MSTFPRELPSRFPKWVRGRYPTAISELEKHNNGTSRFQSYAWRVIESVETARAWRRANTQGVLDPNEIARRRDMAYLETLGPIINATRRIADHIDRYPDLDAWAIGGALLILKEKDGSVPLVSHTTKPSGVNPFGYGPGTAQDVVSRFLRHFSDELRQRPRAKAGPFIHRNQFGPLMYSKPIDRRSARTNPIITGVLFELVYLARLYTSPEPGRLEVGGQLPKTGCPFWPVALAFLEEGFETYLTKKEAQDRLRQLHRRDPGLSWVGWPEPDPIYMDVPPRDAWD